MGKEQYFIITILLVGIVTVLPIDAAGSSIVSSKLPSQSTCGRRKAPNFRIVGGIDSQLGAWPWMVALGYKNTTGIEKDDIQWQCSGTLISNSHVITSCTCVTLPKGELLILARLGDLNLDPTIDDGATPLDIPIKRIIRHKEYNVPDKLTNNIALLVLKNIISFTALIQPICLPQLPDIKNMDMGNSFLFVAGWGTTEYFQDPSSSLKEVQVPIVNITDCRKAYEDERRIDDGMICAGEEGKDACTGDSGSPLMLFKEKQFYLMGIVSFGFQCGVPNYPGVYTRVPYYLDWILERI